ncbi:MAG: hypothetical protein Q8R55_04790 [Candidatus Taylorbacteria bacterium]|nr:hypothetical protein [Candidatus Taylorbacteria bacterium]
MGVIADKGMSETGCVRATRQKSVEFPTDLKDRDILSVVLAAEGSNRATLFIVFGLYSLSKAVIYGNFENELGDSPPRPLYSSDVVSVEKIAEKSFLLEELILDRNSLRKQLVGIEKNILGLLNRRD